ncbi:hypothetical protein PR048_015279 [Dryococelus australis]|uniref:Uncharacterized protein n=1 Tax=Dryococelus australis TaxID=614101 RepID=A0ABQ9HGI0_9NEOP|nr:hypothetical protein PR048_015279 [Dryococelus australis]
MAACDVRTPRVKELSKTTTGETDIVSNSNATARLLAKLYMNLNLRTKRTSCTGTRSERLSSSIRLTQQGHVVDCGVSRGTWLCDHSLEHMGRQPQPYFHAHESGALSLWCNHPYLVKLSLHEAEEYPGSRTLAGLQKRLQKKKKIPNARTHAHARDTRVERTPEVCKLGSHDSVHEHRVYTNQSPDCSSLPRHGFGPDRSLVAFIVTPRVVKLRVSKENVAGWEQGRSPDQEAAYMSARLREAMHIYPRTAEFRAVWDLVMSKCSKVRGGCGRYREEDWGLMFLLSYRIRARAELEGKRKRLRGMVRVLVYEQVCFEWMRYESNTSTSSVIVGRASVGSDLYGCCVVKIAGWMCVLFGVLGKRNLVCNTLTIIYSGHKPVLREVECWRAGKLGATRSGSNCVQGDVDVVEVTQKAAVFRRRRDATAVHNACCDAATARLSGLGACLALPTATLTRASVPSSSQAHHAVERPQDRVLTAASDAGRVCGAEVTWHVTSSQTELHWRSALRLTVLGHASCPHFRWTTAYNTASFIVIACFTTYTKDEVDRLFVIHPTFTYPNPTQLSKSQGQHSPRLAHADILAPGMSNFPDIPHKSVELKSLLRVRMEQRRNERAGKREIPEETRRLAASSGTIPTSEIQGIQPGSTRLFRKLLGSLLWPRHVTHVTLQEQYNTRHTAGTVQHTPHCRNSTTHVTLQEQYNTRHAAGTVQHTSRCRNSTTHVTLREQYNTRHTAGTVQHTSHCGNSTTHVTLREQYSTRHAEGTVQHTSHCGNSTGNMSDVTTFGPTLKPLGGNDREARIRGGCGKPRDRAQLDLGSRPIRAVSGARPTVGCLLLCRVLATQLLLSSAMLLRDPQSPTAGLTTIPVSRVIFNQSQGDFLLSTDGWATALQKPHFKTSASENKVNVIEIIATSRTQLSHTRERRETGWSDVNCDSPCSHVGRLGSACWTNNYVHTALYKRLTAILATDSRTSDWQLYLLATGESVLRKCPDDENQSGNAKMEQRHSARAGETAAYRENPPTKATPSPFLTSENSGVTPTLDRHLRISHHPPLRGKKKLQPANTPAENDYSREIAQGLPTDQTSRSFVSVAFARFTSISLANHIIYQPQSRRACKPSNWCSSSNSEFSEECYVVLMKSSSEYTCHVLIGACFVPHCTEDTYDSTRVQSELHLRPYHEFAQRKCDVTFVSNGTVSNVYKLKSIPSRIVEQGPRQATASLTRRPATSEAVQSYTSAPRADPPVVMATSHHLWPPAPPSSRDVHSASPITAWRPRIYPPTWYMRISGRPTGPKQREAILEDREKDDTAVNYGRRKAYSKVKKVVRSGVGALDVRSSVALIVSLLVRLQSDKVVPADRRVLVLAQTVALSPRLPLATREFRTMWRHLSVYYCDVCTTVTMQQPVIVSHVPDKLLTPTGKPYNVVLRVETHDGAVKSLLQRRRRGCILTLHKTNLFSRRQVGREQHVCSDPGCRITQHAVCSTYPPLIVAVLLPTFAAPRPQRLCLLADKPPPATGASLRSCVDNTPPISRGAVGSCATDLGCGRLWVRIPGKAGC